MKCIALDIDGTITDYSRRLCLSAIKAVREVEKLNIPVILATGNNIIYTQTTATLLGSTGSLISENGGVISKSNIPGEHIILGDIKKTQEAYEYLKNNLPKEHSIELTYDFDYRLSEVALIKTFEGTLAREILKDFDVTVYDTGFTVHITDPKVSKGLALKEMADSMGIDTDEIMSIGDSENDIDLLKHSGLKVAVNNASDDLKEIADYVTTAPYGYGTAEAIKKFVLGVN